MTSPRRTVPRVCRSCGTSFMATKSNVALGWGNYCSRKCRKGEHASTWKGGPEARNAYQLVSVDGIPRLEHILIAERALGHALPAGAQVHHANGKRVDNRNSNLVICQDNGYHRLLHWLDSIRVKGGRPFLDAYCSTCEAVKPVAEFYTRKTPDGHRRPISTCKPCVLAQRSAA